MTAGREQDYGAAGRLGPAVPPEHNHSTTRERCAPGCPSYRATGSAAAPADPPAGREQDARETLRRIERLATDVRQGDDMAAWNALGRIEGEARRTLAALLPSPPATDGDAADILSVGTGTSSRSDAAAETQPAI